MLQMSQNAPASDELSVPYTSPEIGDYALNNYSITTTEKLLNVLRLLKEISISSMKGGPLSDVTLLETLILIH